MAKEIIIKIGLLKSKTKMAINIFTHIRRNLYDNVYNCIVKDKVNINERDEDTGNPPLIVAVSENNKEIVVQLNNLDLSLSNKKDIINFFSHNRNIFQIPNIKWILTGSLGLSDLFINDLKKFSSIIGKPLYLFNMQDKNISDLIDKRYKMSDDLKKILIEDKTNLRDIMNIINIFKKEELKTNKEIGDYFDLFEFNDYEKEVLDVLKNKSMSIKDIAKKLNKSYTAVDKRIKSLALKQAIRKERGACYIQFEAYCSLLT